VQVVLDADCLIAGTLAERGACAELLDRWERGDFEMIACRQLLAEVAKALRHPRIASRYNISEEEVANLTLRLQQEAIFVRDPLHPPRVVPDDPSDDYLVALALGAGADALVTRDHHFDGVRVAHLDILSPSRFLGRLR